MSNFKTKEEYLTFISAWKDAANSENAKSKIVVCDYDEYRWNTSVSDHLREKYEAKGFTVSDDGRTIRKKDGSHYKESGWLNAEHYLFLNIMKGKDPKHGFTPVTAKRKLSPGDSNWRGFSTAAWALHFVVKDAKNYIEQCQFGKKPNSGQRANKFLRPFGGKVSMDDLTKVDLEALEKARRFHR